MGTETVVDPGCSKKSPHSCFRDSSSPIKTTSSPQMPDRVTKNGEIERSAVDKIQNHHG